MVETFGLIRLAPEHRAALEFLDGSGIWGLRPGHNLACDVEYEDPITGNSAFDGTVLEALHRAGLARSYEAEETYRIEGEHVEAGEIEASHRWVLTDAGRTALAAIQRGKEG